MISRINEPKILIVSNNALSTTSNNGKTLASFFSNFDKKNIAQLFFRNEIPDNMDFTNYFTLSDNDILFRKSGKIINPELHNKDNLNKNKTKEFGDLARLFREGVWKFGNWNTKSLNYWLDDFSPDVVFFCAGDSAFAYDIVDYIVSKYSCKLAVYVTDDYVLPRESSSLFCELRRKIILSKMSKAVYNSDLFFTVSDLMKSEYFRLFGKESEVISNFQNFYNRKVTDYFNNEYVNLVYAGGLHFNRDCILLKLANSLDSYNKYASRKTILHVYTNYAENSVLFKESIPSSLKIHAFVGENQLKIILNSCNIPVHVESFDVKSIESTRLSLSTKISEYLSLKKPILAIGPAQIASMKYLEDVAFCINNKSEIEKNIPDLLENYELQQELSTKAGKLYEMKHNEIKQKKIFYKLLCDVV